jgi:hypothetical protein
VLATLLPLYLIRRNLPPRSPLGEKQGAISEARCPSCRRSDLHTYCRLRLLFQHKPDCAGARSGTTYRLYRYDGPTRDNDGLYNPIVSACVDGRIERIMLR